MFFSGITLIIMRSYQEVKSDYNQAIRRLYELIHTNCVDSISPPVYWKIVKDYLDDDYEDKNTNKYNLDPVIWLGKEARRNRAKILKRIHRCKELHTEMEFAPIHTEEDQDESGLYIDWSKSHMEGWTEDGMYCHFDDWETYRDGHCLD